MDIGPLYPAGAELLAALRGRLPPGAGCLPLDAFIDCVLYHPRIGYYTRDRARVGRRAGTDFYTAASIGPVFAMLVVEAVCALAEGPPEAHAFVELGPETAGGLLEHIQPHPFREARVLRPGDPLTLPSPCIVFANEVFDAQPFRRFVRGASGWEEAAVAVQPGGLAWTSIPARAPLPPLPDTAPEGHVVDWPSGAHALLESLCRADWSGLLVAFDYGLDRHTALTCRPQGTGRTYAGHRMGADLLAHAGEADITCHLIWDELEERLARHGFHCVTLESQEAFFVRHAAPAIADILKGGAGGFSAAKHSLMELLHPQHMGRKFQVLHARRRPVKKNLP